MDVREISMKMSLAMTLQSMTVKRLGVGAVEVLTGKNMQRTTLVRIRRGIYLGNEHIEKSMHSTTKNMEKDGDLPIQIT